MVATPSIPENAFGFAGFTPPAAVPAPAASPKPPPIPAPMPPIAADFKASSAEPPCIRDPTPDPIAAAIQGAIPVSSEGANAPKIIGNILFSYCFHSLD